LCAFRLENIEAVFFANSVGQTLISVKYSPCSGKAPVAASLLHFAFFIPQLVCSFFSRLSAHTIGRDARSQSAPPFSIEY
jgi:hypothetical protein